MNLGEVLDYLRVDDEEADAILCECVATGHRAFGATRTFTIRAEQVLAVNLAKKGRPEQERARAMLTRIFAAYVNHFGPEHELTLFVLGHLADVHRRMGNFVKAEELIRQRLAAWRRTKGENDYKTIEARTNLVGCLLKQEDKCASARAEYAGLVPLAERVLGPEHRIVRYLRQPEYQALNRG